MKLFTTLLLVASCLSLQAAAERQRAYSASTEFDASHAKSFQQQQQNYQQQQQQQLSLRLQPTDEFASSGRTLNNASKYQVIVSNKPNNRWSGPGEMPDSSLSDGYHLSDNYHIHKMQVSPEDNFKNYIEDFLHIPTKANWLARSPPNNKLQVISNLSGNIPLSVSEHINNTKQQPDDHRVDKRDANEPFPAEDGQTVAELLGDEYPIMMDRRFQVYRSDDSFRSAPYLSAQEFKETYRRSDPYVVGKRATDVLLSEVAPFSANKRVVPKFVGRRDPPYFVGKRANFDFSEDYLPEPEFDEDKRFFSEYKRAAPKFVGRRGAPYFVGKRRAPVFVGKRNPVFELNDDLFSEDKRGAPRFVGKRRAPYFVGKRESSPNAEDAWTDDYLDWLLEKKGAPKFVGRRGAPYFVGKRGPPMFIGKRVTDPQSNINSISASEYNNIASVLGRRGSPYFVGKRGAPRFVGKRWATRDLLDAVDSTAENKRRAPKFVGKRGSPYFVGKRYSKQFDWNRLIDEGPEDNVQTLPELKRGAPKFVGKRRAPYFVGKREPPRFVGKREHVKLSDPNVLIAESKDIPATFVDSRAVPYFVGKKSAPALIGDKLFNSLYDKEEQLNYVNGDLEIAKDRNKLLTAVGKQTSEDDGLVLNS